MPPFLLHTAQEVDLQMHSRVYVSSVPSNVQKGTYALLLWALSAVQIYTFHVVAFQEVMKSWRTWAWLYCHCLCNR